MQVATIIVIGIVCFSLVVFLVRTPGKLMRVLGSGAVRLVIGVLLLFFFNVFAAHFGLHIPINIFTVVMTSVLGVFGVATLFMIHLILL